jgi:hypothetical protein
MERTLHETVDLGKARMVLSQRSREGSRTWYRIVVFPGGNNDGKKVCLYRDTNRQRAEGAYYYLRQNMAIAEKHAREILAKQD